MSKTKQQNYELFLKKFMEETGKDEQTVRQLMSKLKRADGQLRRIYTVYCNTGQIDKKREIDIKNHVYHLLSGYYRNVKVFFNEDPRGGAVRLVFLKTGWVNTLGGDIQIDW